MRAAFRVGISPEVRRADGSWLYDLTMLREAPDVECEVLFELEHDLAPGLAEEFDALLLATSRYAVGESLAAGGDRLALVARLGAGIEAIDVALCTRADILVTSAPDAVRRPMATSAIAFMLALSLRMLQLDRATREGRWSAGTQRLGMGLTGRTLGLVGLGNIGAEVVRLAQPFAMRFLAYDPYVSSTAHVDARADVRLVAFDELLAGSDVVCVTCRLTPETHHLIDRTALSLLRPGAYLINIARGPIVDQLALIDALREGRLAGAALDVFEQEPVSLADPLLSLDNVIVAPHAIGWTDEFGMLSGRSGSRAVLAVARGQAPQYPLNPSVLSSAGFLQKRIRRTHGQ